MVDRNKSMFKGDAKFRHTQQSVDAKSFLYHVTTTTACFFLHSCSRLPERERCTRIYCTPRTINDKRYAGLSVISQRDKPAGYYHVIQQGSILAIMHVSTVPDLTTLLMNHAAYSELQLRIPGADGDTITEQDAAINGPLVQ